MKLLPNNRLIALGTVASAALSAVGMAVSLVVHAVKTSVDLAHCVKAVDRQELRQDSMDVKLSDIGENVAFLRGQARGAGVAKDLAGSLPTTK